MFRSIPDFASSTKHRPNSQRPTGVHHISQWVKRCLSQNSSPAWLAVTLMTRRENQCHQNRSSRNLRSGCGGLIRLCHKLIADCIKRLFLVVSSAVVDVRNHRNLRVQIRSSWFWGLVLIVGDNSNVNVIETQEALLTLERLQCPGQGAKRPFSGNVCVHSANTGGKGLLGVICSSGASQRVDLPAVIADLGFQNAQDISEFFAAW